jgi:hypothetical protein
MLLVLISGQRAWSQTPRGGIVRGKRMLNLNDTRAPVTKPSREDRQEAPGAQPLPEGQPWNSQDNPLGAKALEYTQIIARIGPEVVLAGEVLVTVDRVMEENQKRIPPARWQQTRRKLMQQMLDPLIESKLILVDALENIPKENLPEIEKKVDEQFYESRVGDLMKAAGVESLADYETKLKENNSTIERQRRDYFEKSLSQQWIQQKLTSNAPISHQEMLGHYTTHLADYQQPAKCRWQQLTARFDKHPSREAAEGAIHQMGNDVLVRNLPFEEVARERSDGLTADDGGRRDWTTRGSLLSEKLDEAIFSLPIDSLSKIITDSTGFHIVQVTERIDVHRTPFRDAQVGIQQEIQEKRRKAQIKKYLASLREKIYVWTIFDELPAE